MVPDKATSRLVAMEWAGTVNEKPSEKATVMGALE